MFLDLNQKCQKQFPLRGIRSPTALLDNPRAFCQAKVLFSWSKEPFSKNTLIQFFILNTQYLNFHYFSFEILYHIFPHNEVYVIKSEDWFWKQTQIKLPLFQVFHRLHEFNFLVTYIYVNKATLQIFDWKKYTSNSISFYYLLNSYLLFLRNH